MKYFFSARIKESLTDIAVLFLRVFTGSFMLTHGLPKLSKATSGAEIKFADPFGAGPEISLWLAVFAEVVCSLLIIIGLTTRLASFFLVCTMSVAAFHAHATDPFATKEKALLYLLIFIAILIVGAGRFSIDRFVFKRSDLR